MATFAPDKASALLSDAARRLANEQPEAFAEYADLAETLLGIVGADVQDEALRASLRFAVTLVVNDALEHGSDGGKVVQSESRGARSVSYAVAVGQSGDTPALRRARKVVDGVLGLRGWNSASTRR